MTDLVKTENTLYTRYEELLIRHDVLKKESFHYQMAYIREFGDLMNQVFEARIKCIENKKIIAYCQRKMNRGEKISQEELNRFIDTTMAEYYDQLRSMLERSKSLLNNNHVSELTFRRIKSVYYRIAKLIHPDMNPSLKDDQTIKDLWNRAVIAYECNDLDDLNEIEVLVRGYLNTIGYKQEAADIPDISEKIFKLNEEIDRILSTDPYQYKYLLADQETVEEKKGDLRSELDDYKKYEAELEEVIATFGIERMVS